MRDPSQSTHMENDDTDATSKRGRCASRRRGGRSARARALRQTPRDRWTRSAHSLGGLRARRSNTCSRVAEGVRNARQRVAVVILATESRYSSACATSNRTTLLHEPHLFGTAAVVIAAVATRSRCLNSRSRLPSMYETHKGIYSHRAHVESARAARRQRLHRCRCRCRE